MSSSELDPIEPQALTPFLVRSDPMVQITVYDATRTLRGQAEGSLRMLLRPGLYRVHFDRGGRVSHEIVDHQAATTLRHDGPALQSPVPFAGAATSHDYYVAPAQQYSATDTAPPLGAGPHASRLFVFVRRAARDGSSRRLPSEPVTILDADGHQLRAITGDNAVIDRAAGYVAYSCRAAPGTYRIRGAWSQRDAAIVVPGGRAAQVFIADTGSLHLAELRLALVPVDARFDPDSPTWSAMEDVIAALRTPDRELPLAARVMLPHAVEDDLCLGIASAHVLWRSGDRHGLAAVMSALARYRELPDVGILDRLDGSSPGEPPRPLPAELPDTPPLMRASLTLAMTRPEHDPGTLSAYCAFAHAARTGLQDSVWCVWSTRTWDERWIATAVERLRDRDGQREAASIARSLALATETVEQALQALDATSAGPGGAPLDPQVLAASGYTLDAVIGRGARSTVYRATRRTDHQAVALKIIPVPGGADGCARALDALDRCPRVDHPRILAVTARGAIPDATGIWLEMELCKASVLDALLERDAALPLPEARRLALDALAVLAHLHDQGIAHGDLTPANLLVRGDGSVALPGLGLASRRAVPEDARHATHAPRLSPPELLRGDEPPSLASDVWAMAATCYFALTLEFPRDEFADQSQMEAAIGNPIVSLARRRPALPAELIRHIDGALSPAPHDRPRDATAFRDRLASLDPAAPPTEAEDSAADDAPAHDVPEPVASGRDGPAAAPPRPLAAKLQDLVKRWRRSAVPLFVRLFVRLLSLLAHASRGRRSIAAASVVLGIIGLLVWSRAAPSSHSCARDVRSGDVRVRAEACLASYRLTGNQRDLALAASAYVAVGDLDEADRLAHRLFAGPLDGDAYAILGSIALQQRHPGEAGRYAALAGDAHRRSGDDRGLVDDAVLLSHVSWQALDAAAAFGAAERALELARRLQDHRAEVAAELARAEVLRGIGDAPDASAALMRANELATEPCDRAWSRLKRSLYLRDTGLDGFALIELAAAARLNPTCGDRSLARDISLNEAWLRRTRDPGGAAATLDALARPADEPAEALLLRGYLAADRGDLAAADRYLDRAAQAAAVDPGWQWVIAWARAEVSEQRGDGRAESQYRQAVARIADLRATARTRSAYLLSSHRGPYDGLITLLARQRRWREVLAVVLDLDASDMLRAAASERVASDPAPPAGPATGPVAIGPAHPSVDDVLSAWQGRDLVLVIAPSRRRIGSGHERAYRLRIARGQVTGEDIGDAGLARALANRLHEHPGDRSTARALGPMMIPRGVEGSPLSVLAIGALGKAPLAALRDDDGSLIIARRPLERVLALATTRPEPRRSNRSVIIADPRGQLPAAAVEGTIVAAAVGPSARRAGSRTGVAATRSLLWTAQDAELLHVAGDIALDGRWRVLRLADGDVEPADVVRRGLAPRIAVLSSNSSAVALDEESWGSPASALLEAGTDVVIATDRGVEDSGVLSVIAGLYSQTAWRADPAQALARVQRALDALSSTPMDDESNARTWAAFGVLRRPPFIAPRPASDPPP